MDTATSKVEIHIGNKHIIVQGDEKFIEKWLDDDERLSALINKIEGFAGASKRDSAAAVHIPESMSDVPANTPFLSWCKQNDVNPATLAEFFQYTSAEDCQLIHVPKFDRKKDGQIQTGLLLGVKHLWMEGKARIPRKELLEQCDMFHCKDSANFSSYMKAEIKLFVPHKGADEWTLSFHGLKEAAALIRSVQDNGKE